MAGCVLRLATTMCGKADQVERVSRDVVGGIARACVSSDVSVQSVMSQLSYTGGTLARECY